jgi:hypothetical protein
MKKDKARTRAQNKNANFKTYVKPVAIGAAIFSLLVLHFAVSQFIAFKSEADSALVELTEKQAAAIEPKVENKAPNASSAFVETQSAPSANAAAKTADSVSAIERVERKAEPRSKAEKEAVGAKRVARETKAERLRRAERILTGI